jgi:hypothetical protein
MISNEGLLQGLLITQAYRWSVPIDKLTYAMNKNIWSVNGVKNIYLTRLVFLLVRIDWKSVGYCQRIGGEQMQTGIQYPFWENRNETVSVKKIMKIA